MALDRTASRASLTYLRRRPKRVPAEKISMERPGRSHAAPAKPSGGTPLTPPSSKPSGGTPLTPPRSKPSGGTPLTPPRVAPTGGTPLTARPVPAPSPTPAPSSTPSLSAALGANKKKPEPVSPARRVLGRTLLTADAPTVTLDRRQSAIGSLSFEIAGPGAVGALWELTDGTAGLVDAAVGTVTSPEFGRRPIVELTQHRILIGLRHVQELRRVLVLVSGFRGNDAQRLIAALHDDATVESSHASTTGPVVVGLAIYQVDGELVIRREDFGFDSGESAAAAYGFKLTWLPPVERRG